MFSLKDLMSYCKINDTETLLDFNQSLEYDYKKVNDAFTIIKKQIQNINYLVRNSEDRDTLSELEVIERTLYDLEGTIEYLDNYIDHLDTLKSEWQDLAEDLIDENNILGCINSKYEPKVNKYLLKNKIKKIID